MELFYNKYLHIFIYIIDYFFNGTYFHIVTIDNNNNMKYG